MADESTTGVAERPPVADAPSALAAEPSAPGEGQAPEQRTVSWADFKKHEAKLQSERARAVQLAQRERDHAAAEAAQLRARMDEYEARSRLPDPVVDPDGHRAELQRQLERERSEKEYERGSREALYRMMRRVNEVAKELSVVIDFDHPMLDLRGGPGGMERLDDSLQRIRSEVEGARKARDWEKQKEVEIEDRVRKKLLADSGADRFDGGSGPASVRQRSGFTPEQIRDPKFYAAHREEILAQYRSGGLDHLASSNRAAPRG